MLCFFLFWHALLSFQAQLPRFFFLLISAPDDPGFASFFRMVRGRYQVSLSLGLFTSLDFPFMALFVRCLLVRFRLLRIYVCFDFRCLTFFRVLPSFSLALRYNSRTICFLVLAVQHAC